MLTIEEAILHCEGRAKADCSECADEHRQLAEWLKELRTLRKKWQEEVKVLSIEEAIQISRIPCTIKEERIPMVLEVLRQAGVDIGGLEELEEWKALKDQAYIIDMDEFVSVLTKDSDPDVNEVPLRPKDFEEICQRFNVKPSCAKRALNRKGLIRTVEKDQLLKVK